MKNYRCLITECNNRLPLNSLLITIWHLHSFISTQNWTATLRREIGLRIVMNWVNNEYNSTYNIHIHSPITRRKLRLVSALTLGVNGRLAHSDSSAAEHGTDNRQGSQTDMRHSRHYWSDTLRADDSSKKKSTSNAAVLVTLTYEQPLAPWWFNKPCHGSCYFLVITIPGIQKHYIQQNLRYVTSGNLLCVRWNNMMLRKGQRPAARTRLRERRHVYTSSITTVLNEDARA
jgi:hypothetical protein